MKNNPLSLLWIGKATISEYQNVTDPETYQTTQKLVPVIIDEPCRLSQNVVSHDKQELTRLGESVPYVEQVIVLFIRPDLEIKAGSVIEVTQHGRTDKYQRASKPAIYSNHQEVVLELYEDNA